MQGRRNEEAGAGWGGVDRDPFWPISNPIPTMGADYAHEITPCPSYGPVLDWLHSAELTFSLLRSYCVLVILESVMNLWDVEIIFVLNLPYAFHYNMPLITTVDYKPQILGPKIVEFPSLVHKLFVNTNLSTI